MTEYRIYYKVLLNLEFWETFKNDDLISFISSANEYLSSIEAEDIKAKPSGSDIDDLLSEVEQSSDSIQNKSNPLLSLVRAYSYQGGPIIARFLPRDQELVNSYLSLTRCKEASSKRL